MTVVSRDALRDSYTTAHRTSDYNHSLWAYFFLRPVAFHLTPVFLRLGFSATAVTLLGLATLVLGLLLAALADSRLVLVTGAALVNVFYVLDFVDGNIARYKKAESLLGELLDFLSGILFHVAMPLAVACYLYRAGPELRLPLPGGHQYGGAAWWLVGVTMSMTFLLRRVITQKMQIALPSSDRPETRRAGWQIVLRSIEAIKTPLLLFAGLLLLVEEWLLFYASFGVVTLTGLVVVSLARGRRVDRARQTSPMP